MDLVSTIRKDGKSRGGQGDFSWENLKDDKHRENYLGHSLKAPVGRWQKGRDLTWWTKGTEGDDEAERERLEEIRKLKEAEQNAMYDALGFKGQQPSAGLGVPTVPGAANPNLEALGTKRSIGEPKRGKEGRSPKRDSRRVDKHHRHHRHRDRSRSRSRSRSRERRRKDHDRNRSRSRSRERRDHSHSHRSRRNDRHSRSRSRSPQRSRRDDDGPGRDRRRHPEDKDHRRSSRERSRNRQYRPRDRSREREKDVLIHRGAVKPDPPSR